MTGGATSPGDGDGDGDLRTAWTRNSAVIAITVSTTMFALVIGFRTTSSLATWLFEKTTYWFLWLGCGLLGWVAAATAARGSVARFPGREIAVIVALAVVLATGVHFAVPCEFRVLADETNLLGTSLSFFINKSATNVTQAIYDHGAFHVIVADPPSRPCLFPFLISLLHSVFGYGDRHGFVVNQIAGCGTLIATAWLGRRLVSLSFGLLAAVLVAALPLFELTMTSCGFEAVNLLLVMLILAQIFAFTERPTALDAEALLALCALGAHCRYETFVLFVPAVMACALRWRALAGTRWSLRIALYPLLIAPLLWQRRLTTVINAGDKISSPFSTGFIPPHARSFAEFFWSDRHPEFPTLRTLTLLAIVGATMLCWRAFRHGAWSQPRTLGALLVTLGALLIFAIQSAFYLGDVRLAFQSRFAATYSGIIGLLAAYPLHVLFAWRTWARAAPVAIAIVALWLGVRVARANELGNWLILFRTYRETMSLLAGFDPAKTLVVSNRSGMYASRMIGGVTIDYAEKNADAIGARLAAGELRDVFVVREDACRGAPKGIAFGAAVEESLVLVQPSDDGKCSQVVVRERRANREGS